MQSQLPHLSSTDVQQAFPELTVGSQLGKGGQKLVFDASDPRYGRVALKLFRLRTASAVERARRELQAESKLSGPSFARVYDFGTREVQSESALYALEEFLDGGSLREMLAVQRRLAISEVVDLAVRLLEALVQVESANLVHRDMKPENIMLANGRVVLIDFGIARHLDLPSLTQDFAPRGPLTPGYAAPEQIRNDKRTISIRTDLFALGVIIYEALAGSNPFVEGCQNSAEALARGLHLNPTHLSLVAPGTPEALIDFVHRCLSKAAHRRPPSASDALAEMKVIHARINS